MQIPVAEMKTCEAVPRWRSKWWMRMEVLEQYYDAKGAEHGTLRFYVPWWAWPLELFHRAIFGYPKLEKIEQC